jgi:hypothetical protein
MPYIPCLVFSGSFDLPAKSFFQQLKQGKQICYDLSGATHSNRA